MICPASGDCWIPASGRAAFGSDSDIHVYLLIAFGPPAGANYFVQYSSFVSSGESWTARGYVLGPAPGCSFSLKAAAVRGTIPAPPAGGLPWTTARSAPGVTVVKETPAIQVRAAGEIDPSVCP